MTSDGSEAPGNDPGGTEAGGGNLAPGGIEDGGDNSSLSQVLGSNIEGASDTESVDPDLKAGLWQ